jgi:hypothetical protein
MAQQREVTFGIVRIENRTAVENGCPSLVAGSKTTRATVLAEFPNDVAIGSLYLSQAGKLYVKVANAGAATDWEVVTQTAAD